MIPTFDEWLALDTRLPPTKWTFKQYGNYVDGWRNSMPWSYRGMSLAYDKWAEGKWSIFPNKDWLILAWKMGMQNNYECLQRGEKQLTAEDAADVVLSIPAMIGLAIDAYFNRPGAE